MRLDGSDYCVFAAPCSIRRLLENPSSTIGDGCHRFNLTDWVLGVCNGLVCLLYSFAGDEFEEFWVQFWNPATRVMSVDSPRLHICSCNYKLGEYSLKCGFGYDDWSDTFKVVAVLFDIKSQNWEVRVHCMGDTCWRKILTCPAFPILEGRPEGQFVSGTVNWLALRKLSFDYEWEIFTVDQLVIFSYDLKNEAYRYLLMPDSLSEVPYEEPCLGVLKGCLCLCHDHMGTHTVVWLMKEFGVEKSWTQLLNVTYERLQLHGFSPYTVLALCMSEDDDVLLLASYGGAKFVLVNRKDNRIDNIDHIGDFQRNFSLFSYDYVRSLVLPYQN